MKFKTTTKILKNGVSVLKCTGYCSLDYLLNYHGPYRSFHAKYAKMKVGPVKIFNSDALSVIKYMYISYYISY